jgi:hypothetical protein
MRKKKISELESKASLAATDLFPVVDTTPGRKLKTKKTTLADVATFIDAVTQPEKGTAGGVATLETESGRLPAAQLPAIAITETFSVNSESAMLALQAQIGDLALREDTKQTFVLQGANAALLSNWQEITTQTPALSTLPDVDGTIPPEKAVLVYDPASQLWRPASIERLVDGGDF